MRKIFLSFMIFPVFLLAQNNPSAQQIKYLYDAGRLWGNVKYFHPYLQYKDINWDSAFMAAVPKILKCNSTRDYALALQQMLTVLKDGATFALNKTNSKATENIINTERGKAYMQDSILIMRLNDKLIADDYNETVKITSAVSNLLDSAKAVVFDLRNTSPDNRLAEPGEINYEFLTGDYSYKGLSSMLCRARQLLPAERFVVHQGFKPEGQSGADDLYQSYFRLDHSNVIEGLRKEPLRIVFLVNKNVAIPNVAIALQRQGLATVLSEDDNTESRAVTTLNYTIDSVAITLRKTELADEHGLVQVKEDSLLAYNDDYAINLRTAIAVAARPLRYYSEAANVNASYNGIWRSEQYSTNHYPALGYRVLAAAKMYSVIHFFNPDKDLFDNNWDSVFLKYLPQFITAKDSVQYMRAVAGMYANMQDSHGFAMSAVRYAWDTLFGTGAPPCVRVARVEGREVVALIVDDPVAKKEGFELGDVVLSVNGRSVDDFINEAGQYFPTSNNETNTGI